MPLSCPACSRANPEGARYCNGCGIALAASGAHTGGAGLRAVTVVLADIVDSTLLAHRLAPPLLAEVYQAFRQLSRQLAGEHGCRRVRFIGDAARITFGPPDCGPEGPAAALSCALALAKALPRISTAASGPIALRIGVAHGTVVLSDELEETSSTAESVVGTPPALAARLAAEAPANAVLCDSATRRLAGPRFEFDDMGQLSLKGFDEPQRSWQVRGIAAPGGMPVARAKPLVGRDAERQVLLDAWQQARAGGTVAAVVVGEPGLGKTVLVDDVAAAAVAAGARRLDLECTFGSAHSPLFPVMAMIDRLAADGHVPATLAGPTQGASPEYMRQERFSRMLADLCALAAQGPLVIVAEDIHWADPSTVEFLLQLRAATSSHAVLQLLTTRPEGAALMKADLSVRLAPLGPDAARLMVQDLAQAFGAELSEATLDWLLQRAEGVPLYLQELSRSAFETRAASPRLLPSTLQHAIQARLDRRPALSAVVQTASVIGRDFTLELLAEMLPGRDDLPVTLAELIDDGLFDPAPGGEGALRFKHALIHEAVYATLLPAARDALHVAAAAILMTRAETMTDTPAEGVAQHLLASGRALDSAQWFHRAAMATHDSAAYAEALGHAANGLQALDRLPGPSPMARRVRRRLLVAQGMSLCATQGYSAPDVERAYRLARELGPTGDAAEDYPIDRGIATYHLVKGDVQEAHRLATQALVGARASARPEYLIDGLCVHGYTCVYTARLAQARASLLECLAVYRAEGGHRLRYPVPQDAGAAAWALLPTVEWLLGLPEAAEASIAGVLEHVARRPDRQFDAALVHAWIAGTRLTQRREREALAHAETALNISLLHGFREWGAASTLVAQIATAILAPSPQAVAALQQTLVQASASGSTLNAPYYLWGLARALQSLGANEAALGVVAQALQQASATSERRMDSELMLLKHELAPGSPADLRPAYELALQQEAATTALRVALRARGDTARLRQLDEGSLGSDQIGRLARELGEGWPA